LNYEDDRDGNTGGDEAVFNGRGAVFVVKKILEKLHYYLLLNMPAFPGYAGL